MQDTSGHKACFWSTMFITACEYDSTKTSIAKVLLAKCQFILSKVVHTVIHCRHIWRSWVMKSVTNAGISRGISRLLVIKWSIKLDEIHRYLPYIIAQTTIVLVVNRRH